MITKAVAIAALLMLCAATAVGAGGDSEDNPHQKMVKDKTVCLDCHTKVPKADEHAPNYFLVDAPSDTCLGCHSEREHPGVHEHAGKSAGSLPGDEKGAIACFTCHDPHPSGVIPGRSVHATEATGATRALAAMRTLPKLTEARGKPPAYGALLRLPTGEVCVTCHGGVRDDKHLWREKLLWDKFLRVHSY